MGSGNDSSKDLLGLLGLLGQKYGLDVGQYTTLSDGHTGEELVQFLVVADGQLKMTGNDPRLLVVTSGVSCQLEDLSCEVLHDGSKVHWGTSTNALAIVSLAQETVDTSHGELKPGTAATGLALALGFASFATSRHFGMYSVLNKEIMPVLCDSDYLYPIIARLKTSVKNDI